MDSRPSHAEYDRYIEILERALRMIRDSTFRNSVVLRSIAAEALEYKRPQ